MEVKSGYKQTEVGVIPENWGVQRLVDLINPDRGVRYGIVQPGKFDATGRYMIRGQDYSRGWVDPDLLFRVSHNIEMRYQNARVQSGELLITIVGASTGTMAIVPDWLDNANLTQTTARLSFKKDRCFSRFIYYLLDSEFGKKQVASYIKGAAQPGLNCGDIEKFLLLVPPLPEQKAIACAINDVDDLIASLDQVIAKKRDLKQAAMQQLLTGKTRLQGFSGEWVQKRLGDVCQIAIGKTPSRINQAYWGKGHPWLSIADVKSKYSFNSSEEITDAGAAIMAVVPKGTLLMTFKLSIGRLTFAARDIYTNEAICSFQQLREDAEYLYYALAMVDFSLYGKQAVKGYTLNKASLKSILVAFPSISEQRAIAELLSEMDAELTELEQRRDKTIALKQGMTQELLTGRTRLA